MVHVKTTHEWHTDDMLVDTSGIRMTYEYIRVTYEYIRVTYGWHTSTYEWHEDGMSKYEWHTDDIRIYTDDIRVHTVLGYLPKSKRGLELAFGAHFLHRFFIQMFLI